MITKEQLERYRKFNGDVDKWVRSQKDGRDEMLNGQQWTQIEKLLQRMKQEKTGYSTQDYRDETKRQLTKTFENEEVIKIARDMINKA